MKAYGRFALARDASGVRCSSDATSAFCDRSGGFERAPEDTKNVIATAGANDGGRLEADDVRPNLASLSCFRPSPAHPPLLLTALCECYADSSSALISLSPPNALFHTPPSPLFPDVLLSLVSLHVRPSLHLCYSLASMHKVLQEAAREAFPASP